MLLIQEHARCKDMYSKQEKKTNMSRNEDQMEIMSVVSHYREEKVALMSGHEVVFATDC